MADEAQTIRGINWREVFPFTAALTAPLWITERAVCTWLALGTRLMYGGVRYRGGVLSRAATPMRVLRQRHTRHNVENALDSLLPDTWSETGTTTR